MVVDGITTNSYNVAWNYATSNYTTSTSGPIYYSKWFTEAEDNNYHKTYSTWATASNTYILDTTTTDNNGWAVQTAAGWAIKYEYDWNRVKIRPKTAREKLQEIIQARIAPAVHTLRQPIVMPQDPREIKAHDTLQLLIGPQRYRQFLKNGYVTIHSQQNGKTYKVYPGTKFTHVYDHGQREQDLCIYLAHDFPPTDQLIAKILLIQTDPNHYHRIANKHRPSQPAIAKPQTPILSLPEIYRELKKSRVA